MSSWRAVVPLAVAVALMTAGLWPLCGLTALVVPGLVLGWLTLPPRERFLEPVRQEPTTRRRPGA